MMDFDHDPDKFQKIDPRLVQEWRRFQEEQQRVRLCRGVKSVLALLGLIAAAVGMMWFLSSRI